MKIRSARTPITAIVAALAMTALSLSACSGDDDSADGSVSVGYFANTLTGLPVEVAEQEGFFEENALDVQIQSGHRSGSASSGCRRAERPRRDPRQCRRDRVGPGVDDQGDRCRRRRQHRRRQQRGRRHRRGLSRVRTAPGREDDRHHSTRRLSDQLFRFIEDDAAVADMEYVTVAGVAENISALESGRVDALNLDPVSAIRVQRLELGHILYDLQADGTLQPAQRPRGLHVGQRGVR